MGKWAGQEVTRRMYPHRIRLRGPWECEPIEHFVTGPDGKSRWSTKDLPSARRVTLPGRWVDFGLDDFLGVVGFRRRFGLPRRLDEWERVWLVCEGVSGGASCRLNGTEVELAAADVGLDEAEVTPLLRERNDLLLRVLGKGTDTQYWGEVTLEVRCRAYVAG